MSFFRRLRNLYTKLQAKPVLPEGIVVGRNVHITDATRFDQDHGRHITVEDDATVAPGVRILCHDASSNRRTGLTWVAPVTIKRGAFIGAESVLMPGVTIGESAIVAAGAVVTKDVAPGTIVAGVPARVIGTIADLDKKRREQMHQYPRFPTDEFGRKGLTPEQDQLLKNAVKEHGAYFLDWPAPQS